MKSNGRVPCLILQDSPLIYTAIIMGNWLLKHSTPVWRLRDPEKGFQRIVRKERAEQMAAAVLDKQRVFPNAIILATDKKELSFNNNKLELNEKLRFLVVDGQHRLWAQKYSNYEAEYVCIIHCNLDEVKMAELFLEINDNQKRVPASLRWDLVRLVRPDDDRWAIAAVDLVYELTNNEESPLYQRVDLTGEVPEKTLNQGSLAPELKTIVSKRGIFRDMDFKTQTQVLIIYLASIRSLDPSGWKTGKTPFYKARIMRVLIRLLPEILAHRKLKDPSRVDSKIFLQYLKKINKDSLSDEEIRAKQGRAGMKAIADELRNQIFR